MQQIQVPTIGPIQFPESWREFMRAAKAWWDTFVARVAAIAESIRAWFAEREARRIAEMVRTTAALLRQARHHAEFAVESAAYLHDPRRLLRFYRFTPQRR